MYDESSEARNTAMFAISSGLPNLFNVIFSTCVLAICRGIFAVISVSINPGQIVLTRIDFVPSSDAHERANAHNAPLLAA